MPLSETAKATPTLPLRGAHRLDRQRDAALFGELRPHCRSGFPARRAGGRDRRPPAPEASSEISTWHCRPFAAARPASESPALRASIRRSKKSCRTPTAAWPLLAASTNRVARLARCSAPALMVSTQRRSRSSRSDVARRSLMARIPVSGVRTSCAKAASAVSTMPGSGDLDCALARLAGGKHRQRVFFDGRLFGGRAVRCERDFDAMIPLSPARFHHAMAGLPESRRSGFSHLKLQLRPAAITARRPGGGYRPASRPRRGVRASRSPRSTSRVSARHHREPGGGAGRRASASRATVAAAGGRWSTRTGPGPRTTSVTPCSASSIATDK